MYDIKILQLKIQKQTGRILRIKQPSSQCYYPTSSQKFVSSLSLVCYE